MINRQELNHPVRGNRGEWSDTDSHDRAMSIPISEVVRELVDLLGSTTVANLGGVGETRAVAQWTEGRAPQRPQVLRFALQLALMIMNEADVDVARAWFHGSNPHLADKTPVQLLRDAPLPEIQSMLMAAARSFASR